MLLGLLPLVLALVGVVSYATSTGTPLPMWLLILVVVWLLPLLLLALSLKMVRVSARGIATGRPTRALREIGWGAVAQVRKERAQIVVIATDGMRISFMPALLHGASELERQLVARLPAQVFSARLSSATIPRQSLHANLAQPRLLSQSALTERPSPGLRAAFVLLTAVLIAGAILSFAALPVIPAIIVAVLACVLAVASGMTAWWLMQSVTIDEQGLARRPFLSRVEREVRWSDMQLIEYTAHERLIRARNGVAVRMAGPGLFSGRAREIYFMLLVAYRSEHDILAVERSWPDLWGAATTTDTVDAREWHQPFAAGFKRPGTSEADDAESAAGDAISLPPLGEARPTPPLATASETQDLPTLEAAPDTTALAGDGLAAGTDGDVSAELADDPAEEQPAGEPSDETAGTP
ncbi:MAG TPA: hypothetical protein VF807_10315 [Ktedonobacterales bacterium]